MERASSSTSHPVGRPATQLPAAPDPANDPGTNPSVNPPPSGGEVISNGPIDIFTLSPVAALKLLCRNVDALAHLTGDIPPTPPVLSPGPSVSGTQENTPMTPGGRSVAQNPLHLMTNQIPPSLEKSPVGSPEAHHTKPEPLLTDDPSINHSTAGDEDQKQRCQRKFNSKRPPPISTTDYVLRIQNWCNMSTGVYLAASAYITRLAVKKRTLQVHPRNAHRLLLAALHVSQKAHEERGWQQLTFSRVGGVTKKELTWLEAALTYLLDYDLNITEDEMKEEAENARRIGSGREYGSAMAPGDGPFDLRMPESGRGRRGAADDRHGEKRKASQVLPSRPAMGRGMN